MSTPQSWDIVVVGAGAAGLLAAAEAAACGVRTLLLEKNLRPGMKILMSGGTRCNITHATDNRGIVNAFGTSGRFLHSALAALSVDGTVDLFEAEGVPTKVEETGKVFPVSNKAADVLDALLRRAQRSGVLLTLGEGLFDLQRNAAGFSLETSTRQLNAVRVILTTGGQSYPGSGTTGDGYRFTQALGHTIRAPRPALVPITVDATWVTALRGITLPDVLVRVLEGSNTLVSRRGSLLVAHFGLSGPVILDVSRVVSGHPEPKRLVLAIDLLPGVAGTALDELLKRESLSFGKKQLAGILPAEIPRRLAEAMVVQLGWPADRKAAGLSRADRSRLVESLKSLRLPIAGTLGFGKAEVTAGGIALEEVDSRTMESKIVPRLYLAGEVLDLDGPIGGYNFQAAFSTGYLAGQSASAAALAEKAG